MVGGMMGLLPTAVVRPAADGCGTALPVHGTQGIYRNLGILMETEHTQNQNITINSQPLPTATSLKPSVSKKRQLSMILK
jgi:hypothetical protein